MSTQDKIINALARQQAQVEDTVEDNQQAYRGRLRELLDDPTQRDPTLWHDALAFVSEDPAWIVSVVVLPVAEFASEELGDIDTMAAFVRAAELQAFLEIAGADILASGLERESIFGEVAGASKSTLQEIGKKGITKMDVQNNRRPR